jgi:glycosyl transferase, family 25
VPGIGSKSSSTGAAGGTGLGDHIFERFERVRIINLVDRPDRRREMLSELDRLGGVPPNVGFHDAHRPDNAGGFPSLGARGCFESHLSVLRSARDAKVQSLLILEDDLDFTRGARSRLAKVVPELFRQRWDLFYGAHLLPTDGRRGLVQVAGEDPVLTASFVAFDGRVLEPLVDFLEGILTRPPGSPDYGPMHVDGAYTVFRLLHPQYLTFAAFPPLGRQRSSPSDITPGNMLLDRWSTTRPFAALLRRAYNTLRRY